MSEPAVAPYLGELRLFASNFAPVGWMLCDGVWLPVAGNEALHELLEGRFGASGDGFALPDLRARVPVGAGPEPVGTPGGAEAVALTQEQLAPHRHALMGTTAPGTETTPGLNQLAASADVLPYAETTPVARMHVEAVAEVGGAGAHANLQPFLCLHTIIAITGEPPSPTHEGLTTATPFVGEVRIFPYAAVPVGWARCNGQVLAISEHAKLFKLIGTLWGGDGKGSFALPDLRGRVPLGPGALGDDELSQYDIGEAGGETTSTLTEADMPTHRHALLTDPASDGHGGVPGPGAVLARSSGGALFQSVADTRLADDALTASGAGAPHSNVQPSLPLTFGIALQGAVPERP